LFYTDPVTSNINVLTDRTATVPSGEVDKTTFLKLLVMQMSNENFMGQLAQFNQLEQSMNLNDSFNTFLSFQALTQATSMIGKDVQAFYLNDDSSTSIVDGKVDEIILLNGTPILKLSSGYEVPIQMVLRVGTDLGE